MSVDKNLEDLTSDNPFVRDAAINNVAKDFFTMEHGQEVKDLMFFGLLSLLLDKGIITNEEIQEKVEEATTFYKILKKRHERLEKAAD